MAVWMDRSQGTLARQLVARGTNLSTNHFEGFAAPTRLHPYHSHTSAIDKAANLSKRLADKLVPLATEAALQGCSNETAPQRSPTLLFLWANR